jgi:hypothetical protein
MMQGLITEMEEAARAGVEDTEKLVAEQFQRQPEDT